MNLKQRPLKHTNTKQQKKDFIVNQKKAARYNQTVEILKDRTMEDLEAYLKAKKIENYQEPGKSIGISSTDMAALLYSIDKKKKDELKEKIAEKASEI